MVKFIFCCADTVEYVNYIAVVNDNEEILDSIEAAEDDDFTESPSSLRFMLRFIGDITCFI